jgi:hypothetical protein
MVLLMLPANHTVIWRFLASLETRHGLISNLHKTFNRQTTAPAAVVSLADELAERASDFWSRKQKSPGSIRSARANQFTTAQTVSNSCSTSGLAVSGFGRSGGALGGGCSSTDLGSSRVRDCFVARRKKNRSS